MSQFRKRPVVIEAVQIPQRGIEGGETFQHFLYDGSIRLEYDGSVSIPTLEGTMRGDIGDWIIKGVKGEFYACKPDIFALTYEAVA